MPLKRGKQFPQWSSVSLPENLSDDELVQIARHGELPQERDQASWRLARSRDSVDAAVTRILHACFDPDFNVRNFAVEGLRQFIVPVHHWYKSNSKPKFWNQSLSSEMREEVIEWMQQVDEYLQTVYISLQVRGSLGDESIIDEVVPLILNDDRWFKFLLIDALGELGTESAVVALRSLFDQKMDPRHRHSVYLNLIRLGCDDGVDWLVAHPNFKGQNIREGRPAKFARASRGHQESILKAKAIVTQSDFDSWAMDAATYFWDELKDLPYDEDIVSRRMLEILG